MPKAHYAFVCDACGADHPKWQGQCSACGQWNTLKKVSLGPSRTSSRTSSSVGYAGAENAVKRLSDIHSSETERFTCGLQELDRVLGGGFVPGSVVLIGGDPGAGKSTLLLQVAARLSQTQSCLYVSGEESMQQIATRADRLGLNDRSLNLASLTVVEEIADLIEQMKPQFVVVDSIQVMQSQAAESVPGSVTQV